ncbi:MAG: DUF3368 domain-containing protein [Pyrinomonadaceae bacterium]
MKEASAADSTCLIGLERVSKTDLIPQLFEPVLIAPEIAREFGRRMPWAIYVSAPDPNEVVALSMLVDSGEAEAIAVAIENDCLLITDDKQARKVARSLDLQVIGTVGILIRAKQQGLIESIKPIIDSLEATGFHISRTLIREALEIVGEFQ